MLLFQYTQPSYGYSLTQQPQTQTGTPLAQATFAQPSLFLQQAPSAAAQSELFQTANQLSAYRNQYGQSQQNTIMVSSATSSLMSTTIKPPNAQNQYSEYILYVLITFRHQIH